MVQVDFEDGACEWRGVVVEGGEVAAAVAVEDQIVGSGEWVAGGVVLQGGLRGAVGVDASEAVAVAAGDPQSSIGSESDGGGTEAGLLPDCARFASRGVEDTDRMLCVLDEIQASCLPQGPFRVEGGRVDDV